MKKSDKKIIPVVFAADESYAPYVSVCIESIKANSSRSYCYKIYVFHSGLSPETRERLVAASGDGSSVECVDLSREIEKYKEDMYSHAYFSPEMYYRILIPELLPDYDKVIYLDCDTVALGDLSELYLTDISGYAIGACRNVLHKKLEEYVRDELSLDPLRYINSGVLLINTRVCREIGFFESAIKMLAELPHLSYPDQDIINLVLRDRIFYLDMKWNYLWHIERLAQTKNPDLHLLPCDAAEFARAGRRVAILHFTGDMKPWKFNAIPKAEIFWKYAGVSSFSRQIREKFRKDNAKLCRVKLVFVDYKRGQLRITCSYNRPTDAPEESCGYIISGNVHTAEYFHKRRIASGGVLIEQKLFYVRVPLVEIAAARRDLSFTLSGRAVLFEYDKFFPLNGHSRSYFAHNGILLYREGRRLMLEKSTVAKRARHEAAYLFQLLGSKKPLSGKYFFVRLVYFLTKYLVPRHIWLISDRPSVAGDNGEALFRYLSENERKYRGRIRAYFVINRESPDYKRLRRIGRVIAASSPRHKIYSLHCEVKAASQTDRELYDVTVRNQIKDLLYTEKRVFLQHGVTKDDISDAYSRYLQDFDLFITASYREYESILSNPNYGAHTGSVKLTGFPRHDLLRDGRERVIVITPTWRRSLDFAESGEFSRSQYFLAWQSVIKSPELLSLAREWGYEIWFVPHNNTERHLGAFGELPAEIKVISGSKNYAEIFSRASLLITDYSSNSFEFSYLGKPVIYYQFDREEFFSSHTYRAGYFDYVRDGFGEVVRDEGELLLAVRGSLLRGCEIEEKYKRRIDRFFKYRDMENSSRVVSEILKLWK